MSRKFQDGVVYNNLNPIANKIEKRFIHFDTMYRDNQNGCPENSLFTLKDPIRNIISVKLYHLELAFTWFYINEKNNHFYFTVNLHDSSIIYKQKYKIELEKGNYSLNSLLSVLSTTGLSGEYIKYTPIQNEASIIHDDPGFSITNYMNSDLSFGLFLSELQSQVIVKMRQQNDTISLKTSPPSGSPNNLSVHSIEIDFFDENYKDVEDKYNTLGWLLGYRKNKYTILAGETKIIKTESIFDGVGDRYIYFRLDDYQHQSTNNDIAYMDTHNIDNILGKVVLYDNRLSLNMQEYSSIYHAKERVYHGMVDFKKFNVQLIDRFGNLIPLNEINFSFTLEIEQIYSSI